MGFTTKDIAIIFEPKRVSLSALPNFIQFKSKPGVKTFLEFNLAVNIQPKWRDYSFYNIDGDLIPIPEYVEGAKAWQSSRLISVAGRTGQTFVYHGYAEPLSACVFFAANGSVVSTFQTPTGTNTATGTIPVGAVTVGLSNNQVAYGGVDPTFVVGGTNLLNFSVETQSILRIVEPSGVVHQFSGTTDTTKVGGATYFISSDKTNTAENIRQALIADRWIDANFNVRIPTVLSGGSVTNGSVINIESKGTGSDYNITTTAPNNTDNVAYTITVINPVSINADSISGEASTVEIDLDVYTDAPLFLGEDDFPTTSDLLGTFAITLSKTYSGDTLWFDVNGPFAKATGFTLPSINYGWFNTGTLRVFRFIARVAGINNFAFYISNALYVLRGYGTASDPTDLEDYVYLNEPIKLLTNKPRTIYVRGQREYLNFMFSDADRGETYVDDWTANILYRAYDTVGNYLGQMQSDAINRSALNMVNTCTLRIDDLLDLHPSAGLIRVCLSRSGAVMSNDLEYTVRPSSLHTLRQFSFLNRLGGWDSFNFDAAPTKDTKVTFDTFTKTVTPEYRKGDGIETVYAAQLDDTITVVGAPVTDEVAEWLKELAASTVVLDADGNYVIKSEFSTPISDGAKNMQVPTMKYQLSETYTNE